MRSGGVTRSLPGALITAARSPGRNPARSRNAPARALRGTAPPFRSCSEPTTTLEALHVYFLTVDVTTVNPFPCAPFRFAVFVATSSPGVKEGEYTQMCTYA